jgi:hypothetical protein
LASKPGAKCPIVFFTSSVRFEYESAVQLDALTLAPAVGDAGESEKSVTVWLAGADALDASARADPNAAMATTRRIPETVMGIEPPCPPSFRIPAISLV